MLFRSWDPHGYWGARQNFWVFDVPFLTHGANCSWVQPAGKNGKSCDGQFYGVGAFQTDFDSSRYAFKAPIEVTRQDANGAEIGRWSVADGNTSTMLPNMRHFAARTGARYVLRFPGKPNPRSFAMSVSNAFRAGDSFVFAVAFDGSVNATGYLLAGSEHNRDDPKNWASGDARNQHVRRFTATSSLAEVQNSPGDRLWQDRANNLVWIKYQGGLPFPNEATLVANSDAELYRTFSVLIY